MITEHVVDLGFLPWKVYFFVWDSTTTPAEMMEHMKDKGFVFDDVALFKDNVGFADHFTTQKSVCVVRTFSDVNREQHTLLGVMAHEVYHNVDYVRSAYSMNETEPTARLYEYLFNEGVKVIKTHIDDGKNLDYAEQEHKLELL